MLDSAQATIACVKPDMDAGGEVPDAQPQTPEQQSRWQMANAQGHDHAANGAAIGADGSGREDLSPFRQSSHVDSHRPVLAIG
ncbi:hypothetical protein SCARD494_11123 [Seiridium cardinale]